MCSHGQFVVDDTINGCEVCTQCGIILENILSHSHEEPRRGRYEQLSRSRSSQSSFLIPSSSSDPSSSSSSSRLSFVSAAATAADSSLNIGNEFIIRNELHDALAVLHMDTSFIVEQVISNIYRFSKMCMANANANANAKEEKEEEEEEKSHQQKKKSIFPLNPNLAADRGMLAFILWETLNQNDCSRSPQEIAYVLNVCPNEMQKSEKYLRIAPTFCLPSTYVQRLCAEIGLTFRMASVIERAVCEVNHFMHKPETIIGGVLLEIKDIIRERDKQTDGHQQQQQDPNKEEGDKSLYTIARLTSKEIASMLNVSVSSLYSIRTKLPDHCLRVLTEGIKMFL